MKFINDKALLKLNIHILAMGYIKKRAPYFIKITRENGKTNDNGKKTETILNLDKKTKKKILHKVKRDMQALLFIAPCLSLFPVFMPVP